MKYKNLQIILYLTVIAVFITSCGSIQPPGSQPEPTEIPVVISDTETVAEGRIIPNEEVDLSFFTNGQVEEVFVEEGDQVKKDDVVAILGNSEDLEAAIANAEAELLSANQALDDLYENNDIAKTEALRAVTEANRAVRDAQYQLDNFTIPINQTQFETFEAVSVMKERLDKARANFEPYKYRSSSNQTRQDLKDDLEEAQSDYDSAIKRLEYETALNEAQNNWEEAHEDLEILQEGPDPKDIESSESRIKAAEAALKSAEAALDHLELLSTIDGTVVEQDLIIGQDVTAGQPVMKIVDFSKMYAETDDLTELEVVDISVGQKVTIEPDAIPGLVLNGKVEKISDIFEEKRGDITYTTKILIDDIDPRLRWGMTVLITFLEE
ncbi:MAG: HlyD family secretion protein [Anaerolineales bacterium]|jgi:multidrug efflux pump subunit AcrA (membrane-fusion protein)